VDVVVDEEGGQAFQIRLKAFFEAAEL